MWVTCWLAHDSEHAACSLSCCHKQQLHELNFLFSFLSWDKGLVFQACCKRWAPKGLNLPVDKSRSVGLRKFESDRKDERAEPCLKLQAEPSDVSGDLAPGFYW